MEDVLTHFSFQASRPASGTSSTPWCRACEWSTSTRWRLISVRTRRCCAKPTRVRSPHVRIWARNLCFCRASSSGGRGVESHSCARVSPSSTKHLHRICSIAWLAAKPESTTHDLGGDLEAKLCRLVTHFEPSLYLESCHGTSQMCWDEQCASTSSLVILIINFLTDQPERCTCILPIIKYIGAKKKCNL